MHDYDRPCRSENFLGEINDECSIINSSEVQIGKFIPATGELLNGNVPVATLTPNGKLLDANQQLVLPLVCRIVIFLLTLTASCLSLTFIHR